MKEVEDLEAALGEAQTAMFPDSTNSEVTKKSFRPLRIAVIGSHGKAWAREQAKGWGTHTVDFLDTDRLREIRGRYDLLVEAGASHKATEHLQAQNGWNMPIARFGNKTVHSTNDLRNWITLY